MAHRVAAQEAGPFFGRDDLPEAGVYYIDRNACLAFWLAGVPGAWFVHVGIKREGRAKSDDSIRAILRAFWGDFSPVALVAWFDTRNRSVAALARRVGFTDRGEVAPNISEMVWRP